MALYTAASSSERIAFNTLNRKTGNRVKRELNRTTKARIVWEPATKRGSEEMAESHGQKAKNCHAMARQDKPV